MKIVLQNEKVNDLGRKIEQVVASVLEKMDASSIEGYDITADILVEFKVKGSEEGMYIMTDRVIMGQPEVLTIIPEFDEKGNLVGTEDNTEETFEAVAAAMSRDLPTEPVESEFDNDDLTVVDTTAASDLKEVVYKHKDGRLIIRYYRKDVGLVGEISAEPKGGAVND